MYLATSEQMQEFDKFTIHTLRVPGIVLMDHAGFAVAQKVAELRPRTVVVLCGKGNNGGDGWVVARWLRHWGQTQVEVMSMANPSELQGDARMAAEMALAAGVPYQVYRESQVLREAEVYVDALLGTGITRPVEGDLAQLIQAVNRVSALTVAVDVPSGVNASSGEVLGVAVQAQHTVCLGLAKLGTAVSPGCYFAGEVTTADIGIPAVEPAHLAELTEARHVQTLLPKRAPDAHKGSFGRLGVMVGEMRGAALLAGLGAARSGAGLVVLGGLGREAADVPYEFVLRQTDVDGHLLKTFADCRSLVMGPGLGQVGAKSADIERWQSSLSAYPGTGVLDADGLRLLTGNLALLANGRWVLTPHPKECGRLLGWTTDEVQQKRVLAVCTLSERTGCVVVLKGFKSLIAGPDRLLAVNPTGDASLATAGTGDVLAGVIGSLLAQGLTPFEAARAGAYLHGLAGELAGQQRGKAGTMASDVVACIPLAINKVLHSSPRE